MKIDIFFHVAGFAEWKTVFDEIVDSINSSGILSVTNKIHIGFVGSIEEFVNSKEHLKFNESVTVNYLGDLKKYELPTIELLQDFCSKNKNATVLYFHTKGLSLHGNPIKKYWRKAMIKAVILEWKKCYNFLIEGNDLVGYNWWGNHFSGNFWYAKAKVINKTKRMSYLINKPYKIWEGHTEEERKRLQAEFLFTEVSRDKSLKAKSVGVERFDGMQSIPLTVPLETPVGDTFKDAGIKIDKTFLINLPKRIDRLRAAKEEFLAAGIKDFTRFTAINAITNGLTTIQNHGHGMVGCYLSHLAIVNEAYDNGYENIFITEDDVKFVYGFHELFPFYFKNVPPDWELLWVGSWERFGRPARTIADRVCIPQDAFGTHAFMLSRKGIERVYHHLNTTPLETHIDITLTRLIPDLVEYSFFPALAIQSGSASDINPNVSLQQVLDNPNK